MTKRCETAWLLCLLVICGQLFSIRQGAVQQTPGPGCRARDLDRAQDRNASLAWSCAATHLALILQHLQWRSIIIIYDQDTEVLLGPLLETRVLSTMLVSLVTADQAWTQRGLPASIVLGPKGSEQRLYILLLCQMSTTEAILRGASSFQRVKGQQTAIRETSQWLLTVPAALTCGLLQQIGDVTLNNVALVSYLTDLKGATCCLADLHALHTTPQGPQFFPVSSRTLNTTSPPVLGVSPSTRTAPPPLQSVLFPSLGCGLNGRKLVVTTIESASFLTKNEDGQFQGVGMEFLEALAKFLNFTYEMVEIHDKQYGGRTGSGEWNGMIGALHRQEADLALAELTPSLERSEVADFTVHFSRSTYVFCYRRPPVDTSPALLFLKPFRWQVLMCLGFAALGTALFIYVVCLVSPTPVQGERRYPFLDSLFLVLETSVANSGTPMPRATAGLVTLSAWLLTCLVVGATYTGNLVAFLAVTKGPAPISTLQQLVSQRQYPWGLVNDSYIANVLATSTLPIFQKIWAGIQEFSRGDSGVLARDVDALTGKMSREDFVAIDTDDWLLEYGATLRLQLICSEEAVLPGFVSLALPNNSAYTDLVSDAILAVTESGIMEVWRRQWLKQYNYTRHQKSGSPTRHKPADLQHTQMAFQGLLVGATVAALVLLLERVVNRVRDRRGPFFTREHPGQRA